LPFIIAALGNSFFLFLAAAPATIMLIPTTTTTTTHHREPCFPPAIHHNSSDASYFSLFSLYYSLQFIRSLLLLLPPSCASLRALNLTSVLFLRSCHASNPPSIAISRRRFFSSTFTSLAPPLPPVYFFGAPSSFAPCFLRIIIALLSVNSFRTSQPPYVAPQIFFSSCSSSFFFLATPFQLL
jgi:hypothetical protein